METKITILEGPSPTFEAAEEGWVFGLCEGPHLAELAFTRLRAFNGAALVERCHHTWRNGATMFLEFRSSDGLIQEVPIVAARYMETDDGDLLLLWVRLGNEDVELELDYGDEGGEGDEDDDFDFSDYL